MPRQIKRDRPSGRSTDRRRSLPVNPLADVHAFSPTDFAEAYEAAEMILRCGRDGIEQLNFWDSLAHSIMTMLILHLCYEATQQKRVASLTDLAPTLEPARFRALLPELVKAKHDPGREHGWRMRNDELTTTHPFVRQQATNFLETPDSLLAGGLLEARSAISRFHELRRRDEILRRSEERLRRYYAQRT